MSEADPGPAPAREPVLSPVDRVSELLFGLFMALTFVGAVSVAMLFGGGLALGRHAGYGSWKVGFMMAGLGTALVVAINALGG